MVRTLQVMLLGPFPPTVTRKRAVFLVTKPTLDDLAVLKELVESKAITPVLDRRYPLGEVPDAIRYLEAGHTRGKVVIHL